MATILARRRSDGSMGYTAQIRIKRGGKVVHTESRTFSKKAIAKEWAAEREEQLKRDPASATRAAHRGKTVGDIIMQYLTDREAIEPLGRSKGAHLRQLLKYPITDREALQLTPLDVIEHIRQRRLGGTGPATAGGDLIWLRVVWRYARTALGVPVRMDVIDDAAEICKAERMTAKSKRRTRRPTADELRRLDTWFRAAHETRKGVPPMHLIMWLAIYSCRRLEELCKMRISDWDQAAGTWLIRDLKHPGGSVGHHASMVVPEKMLPVVEALRRVYDDERLVPLNHRSVGAYWQRQLKLMGIEDLHWHDLRHEACSRLAEDGLTIPAIQQVSLHESWSSLQRYVNLRPSGERVNFNYAAPSNPLPPSPAPRPDTPPDQ